MPPYPLALPSNFAAPKPPLTASRPPPRAHAPGGDRGHGPSPPHGGLKARAGDDKYCRCRPLRAQNVMGPLTAEQTGLFLRNPRCPPEALLAGGARADVQGEVIRMCKER
jgi:hypothetical protein